MQQNNSKIVARLRFNDEIILFKLHAQILIVSSGGGLYIFSLHNMQKIESLQCSSVFASFMSIMPNSRHQVDCFRIIYSDPGNRGKLNIYSYEHPDETKKTDADSEVLD